MGIEDRRFELFSSEYSELLNMWLNGRINNLSKIDTLLLEILQKLELESYNKMDSVQKNTNEYAISNALAKSSGYAAVIIEERLEETIHDHLEVQRKRPEKVCDETLIQLVSQFKLLALECFVSGIVAGKYNILEFENDIIRAHAAAEVLKQNNIDRSKTAKELSKKWRTKADEILARLISCGRDKKSIPKSEIIKKVILELDLASEYPNIKMTSLQMKVRRQIFPNK